MEPNQVFWGGQRTLGGWMRGTTELRAKLVADGLPDVHVALLGEDVQRHIQLSEHMSEVLSSGLEVTQSIYNNQLQAINNRFAYIANRELGVLSIFDTTRKVFELATADGVTTAEAADRLAERGERGHRGGRPRGRARVAPHRGSRPLPHDHDRQHRRGDRRGVRVDPDGGAAAEVGRRGAPAHCGR